MLVGRCGALLASAGPGIRGMLLRRCGAVVASRAVAASVILMPGDAVARPVPRRGLLTRLFDFFHTHPRGRRYEFAFWFGLAALFGLGAYVGWRVGFVNDAIALVLGVVALAIAGWSLLPQHRVASKEPPRSPKSKRRG